MATVFKCDACDVIIHDERDVSRLWIDNDEPKDICQECKRKILNVFVGEEE